MKVRMCYEVVLACVKLGDEPRDNTAVKLIPCSASTPIPPHVPAARDLESLPGQPVVGQKLKKTKYL